MLCGVSEQPMFWPIWLIRVFLLLWLYVARRAWRMGDGALMLPNWWDGHGSKPLQTSQPPTDKHRAWDLYDEPDDNHSEHYPMLRTKGGRRQAPLSWRLCNATLWLCVYPGHVLVGSYRCELQRRANLAVANYRVCALERLVCVGLRLRHVRIMFTP